MTMKMMKMGRMTKRRKMRKAGKKMLLMPITEDKVSKHKNIKQVRYILKQLEVNYKKYIKKIF